MVVAAWATVAGVEELAWEVRTSGREEVSTGVRWDEGEATAARVGVPVIWLLGVKVGILVGMGIEVGMEVGVEVGGGGMGVEVGSSAGGSGSC